MYTVAGDGPCNEELALRMQAGDKNAAERLISQNEGYLTELTRAYKPHGKKNPRDKGRQLAIVVNGRLMTAPVIQEEINGGEFSICGNFSREEAMKLAASLNGKLVVK